MTVEGREPEAKTAEDQETYKRAEERATAKVKLIKHLISFCILSAFFAAINLLTSREHYWFLWVVAAMGFGLLMHGYKVFFAGGMDKAMDGMKARILEKELEREKQQDRKD